MGAEPLFLRPSSVFFFSPLLRPPSAAVVVVSSISSRLSSIPSSSTILVLWRFAGGGGSTKSSISSNRSSRLEWLVSGNAIVILFWPVEPGDETDEDEDEEVEREGAVDKEEEEEEERESFLALERGWHSSTSWMMSWPMRERRVGEGMIEDKKVRVLGSLSMIFSISVLDKIASTVCRG